MWNDRYSGEGLSLSGRACFDPSTAMQRAFTLPSTGSTQAAQSNAVQTAAPASQAAQSSSSALGAAVAKAIEKSKQTSPTSQADPNERNRIKRTSSGGLGLSSVLTTVAGGARSGGGAIASGDYSSNKLGPG